MNLNREIKIITFFIILSVVVGISFNISNFYQVNQLHQVTEDIYEHTFQVSKAALRVENSILRIEHDVHIISYHHTDKTAKASLENIAIEEDKIKKNLKIVEHNILGEEGSALYKKTAKDFEIFYKLNIVETEPRKLDGLLVKIEAAAMDMQDYTEIKANFFMQESQSTFEDLKTNNIYSTLIIISVILLFFFYLKKRVQNYMLKAYDDELRYKKLNERFERAIDGTNDGLWDWNVKTETLYLSPRWKEMLGYQDSELPNDFSTWESRVHPDDLAQANAEIEKAQKDPSFEYNTVHRLRHKDGSWVWILDRGQTEFDAEGKAVRMTGFHTDITELKEQELAIKNLSILLNNTINSFDNLIFVKDSKFRYLECNKAFEKFIGIAREDLLGKSDYDIFDKESADFFRSKDEAMLSAAKTINNYEWVTYPDAHKVYLLTSKSPLHDKNGKILGLVGNSIDVTREKVLEDELAKKDEIMIAQSRHAAMGEMISMIAHQWRQPISVIAMDANNILVDIELESLNEQELLVIAKDIISQTQELSKTIDDFKEFFKPDRNTEDILLASIVDDALNVIGKSLENNDISLDIDMNRELRVVTYSRELMQVFINIIKNAKEILVEKEIQEKKIWIVVKKEDSSFIIQFYDNAGGIRKDVIGKVFDPYFTTKGEKNGTGLGLYMSKTIIEKHLHGQINVSNQKEGACFEIEIPFNLNEVKKEVSP